MSVKGSSGTVTILPGYAGDGSGYGGGIVVTFGERAIYVTAIDHVRGYSQEDVKFAHLIAAAPEMLEALKAVMDNESDWKTAQEFGGYVLDDDVREQVHAAIKKATGAKS